MDVDVPALWHATLRTPSTVKAAVVCTIGKEQLLVTLKGSWIEMLKPDAEQGRMELRSRQNLFANARDVASIRLPSEKSDRLALSTDSGCFVLLKYEREKKSWIQEVCEPYGRSGIRRSIPGEYIASDPRGRACMVAAFEKSKLVYVVNRDGSRATVNSPLVVDCPDTFVYCVTAIDVGYSNPQFCCLEQQQGGPKTLALYELDLGLNHTTRRKVIPVNDTSCVLAPLPGGREGPSGVLVGSLGQVEYFGLEGEHQAAILPNQAYVVTATVHKMKSGFFVLVQTSDGSLFKVTYQDLLRVHYFDHIPPATSLSIFKSGFLYVASETGDHSLYQFLGLEGTEEYVQGKPMGNVSLVEQFSSLAPLMGSYAIRRDSGLVALGSGVRKLEVGLVPNILVDAPLPPNPLRIFSVRTKSESTFDEFILLSFAENTLVLAVSPDGNVQETSDHNFVTTIPTLNVHQVGENSVVQVHSRGIRQIFSEKSIDWSPGSETVITAAVNSSQVLIGTSGSKAVYFETDEDGVLVEYQKPAKFGGPNLECVAISPVPKGRVKSQFAAIGFSNSTLRVISLESPPLSSLGVQVLPSTPTSLAIESGQLHVGLDSGGYVACKLNDNSGVIEETSTRIAGSAPVKVARFLRADDERPGILILSNRTWLAKSFGDLAAVKSDPVCWVAPFSSSQCPRGALAIVNGLLRVFTLKTNEDPLRITSQPTPDLITRVIRPQNRNTELYVGMNGIFSEGRTLLTAHVTAACTVRFESASKEFLAVAVDKEVRIYSYGASELHFVHSTPLDYSCRALAPYRGFLLAGVGNRLVEYDLGRKRLLRQVAVVLNGSITVIRVSRDINVWLCAGRHIVLLVDLVVIADDPISRATTFLETLDASTVVCGDKFGSICILRLPQEAEHLITDSHGVRIVDVQKSRLNGSAFKIELVAQFYVDDAITALYRTTLVPGGSEAIIYTGMQGTVGALVPFESFADYKFASKLEYHLREDFGLSLVGRDHLSFRGYYAPSRNVIDVDFCKEFSTLNHDDRSDIAEKIGSTSFEIDQRLSELWSRSLWT